MTIKAGQVYESCNALDEGRCIRIEKYTPGDARAHVVDAVTGKRFRQILVRELHETGTTRSGEPRRSGYQLVETEAPASTR